MKLPALDFFRKASLGLAALFVVVFGLYLRTLSPAFHPDDSAETITAGATLGVQHPPSYPLHSLLGRLAVALGPGPASFDVNLLAAFAAALAAVLAASLVYALGREFAPWATQQGRLAAFAVAVSAVMAFTQTLWFQATIAKGGIYTLNLALSLGALLAVLRVRDAGLTWSKIPPPAVASLGADASCANAPNAALPLGAFALLGLLFGLGLANHWASQAVLLPCFALLLAEAPVKRGARALFAAWGPGLGISAFFMIPGLVLYAYVPLRGRLGAGLVWGDASTWAGLWDIVTRNHYAGLEGGKTWAAYGALWGRIAKDCVTDWTWPGLGALALGWALLFRKRLWLACGLFAWPLGLAVAVAAKANPPADSLFIVDPYLIPLQVGLGLGLAGFMAVPPLRRRLAFVFLAAACGLAAWQWHACDHSDDYLAWDYAHNLLLGVPAHSLLFCEGDANVVGLLVPRLVQGRRRDLTPIVSVLIELPWYRAALLLQDPSLKLPPSHQGAADAMAWMAAANAPRPAVWTNGYRRDWVDERHLLARGLVFVVTDALRPFGAALLSANDIWAAFSLRGVFAPDQRPMDPLTVRVVRQTYQWSQMRLADAYNNLNDFDDAIRVDRRLGVLNPGWADPWLLAGSMAWHKGDTGLASQLWSRATQEDASNAEAWADLGLVDLQLGQVAQADQFAHHALALDPDLADAKTLVALASEAPKPGDLRRRIVDAPARVLGP